MAVSGEVNQWAEAVVNVVGVQGRRDQPDFAILNLTDSSLPPDVLLAVKRAAYSREDDTAAYVPGYVAREMGASLLAEAEVAEPGTRLASEDDFVAFAGSVMPDRDEREVRKRTVPVWSDLRRAVGAIESSREWLAMLPILKEQPSIIRVSNSWRTPGELRQLAALPLRFVLPADHEETGTRERSVDLESLHGTLDSMLAEGYPKASKYFWRLGRVGLDLLARFTNAQFPERPPLPTKG